MTSHKVIKVKVDRDFSAKVAIEVPSIYRDILFSETPRPAELKFQMLAKI